MITITDERGDLTVSANIKSLPMSRLKHHAEVLVLVYASAHQLGDPGSIGAPPTYLPPSYVSQQV